MLVDAEAAGMHADCPSCGVHVMVPKVRAMHDRDYSPVKPVGKRGGSRNGAPVVPRGAQRANGNGNGQYSDPEISELREELLDASVQTSALEREVADARAEAERLKAELQKAAGDAESRATANRKFQDELKRLAEEHQQICNKYTAAASDRDTALACTQQMADEIEQLRRRAEAAESLMEEAHQQLQVLQAEEIELSTAVASAQEEIAFYARRNEEQERELAAERSRYGETQSEWTAALRRIDALEQQLAGIQTELATTRAALALTEQKAAKLKVTEHDLSTTVARLKTAEERVLTLEKGLSECTTECQSLRRSLSEDTVGKDLMATRDQLAEVSKERDHLDAETRHLSDTLHSLTAAKSERDEQIKTLTRELDEARRRAEAASEARLRQDNEVLRGIIARQNSELEQKHTQLVRLKRARFGVRLAYASFALALVLVLAWAIKTVPGLQLSGFFKF
jgi:chromosome segregation ATPase